MEGFLKLFLQKYISIPIGVLDYEKGFYTIIVLDTNFVIFLYLHFIYINFAYYHSLSREDPYSIILID